MHQTTVLLSLLSCLLLSACQLTPVNVSSSTTRLDSPEVSSKPLQVSLALGVGSRSQISVEETDMGTDDGIEGEAFIRGNITALEGLELSVYQGYESPHFSIKYQFYGQHTEQATKGNFSQAISFGFERNTSSDTYEKSNWFNDSNIYDLAWVLGYRVSDSILVYGGPIYQWGNLKGQKTIADSYYSKEEPYEEYFEYTETSLKSNGKMYAANIAIEYRFAFGLGLGGEMVVSNLIWDGYNISDTAFNCKIDYRF